VKYKACLVVCENEYRHGLDFQKTFVHVVKWSTICCLVSIVAQHGWEILHMDVKSTFFNDQIKEDVFVRQAHGFIVPSLEHKVCTLKRTLYGLCQSPQGWHERINVFLQKTNLILYLVDPSQYIFQKYGLIFTLAIYVDDLMLIDSHDAKLEWVRDELCFQFDMSY
jgi:hypothetical protein